jgi:hypothetical protein
MDDTHGGDMDVIQNITSMNTTTGRSSQSTLKVPKAHAHMLLEPAPMGQLSTQVPHSLSKGGLTHEPPNRIKGLSAGNEASQ